MSGFNDTNSPSEVDRISGKNKALKDHVTRLETTFLLVFVQQLDTSSLKSLVCQGNYMKGKIIIPLVVVVLHANFLFLQTGYFT